MATFKRYGGRKLSALARERADEEAAEFGEAAVENAVRHGDDSWRMRREPSVWSSVDTGVTNKAKQGSGGAGARRKRLREPSPEGVEGAASDREADLDFGGGPPADGWDDGGGWGDDGGGPPAHRSRRTKNRRRAAQWEERLKPDVDKVLELSGLLGAEGLVLDEAEGAFLSIGPQRAPWGGLTLSCAPHYLQATWQFLNKVSVCPVVCSATSVTVYGTKFGGPSVRTRLLSASSVGMPFGG
jgi:hypothetical protein